MPSKKKVAPPPLCPAFPRVPRACDEACDEACGILAMAIDSKREKLRGELSKALLQHGGASTTTAAAIASDIDEALCSSASGRPSSYTRQARALMYNLPRNPVLCSLLTTGAVAPEEVAHYTPDELLTPEKLDSKLQLERRCVDAVDVTQEAHERDIVQAEHWQEKGLEEGEDLPSSMAANGDA